MACATRSGSRPARPRTATAPASVSIIDPGQRALAIDLDGVLNFEQRAPSFEGTATLAAPASAKGVAMPWKIVSKVKADYAAARLDQIEVNYGPEDRALRFTGNGDVSFGASPLLRASLSARQLDADRFAAKDNAAEPVRVLPAMRALLAGIPPTPIPTQVEFASEQIMLGGRPLQDVVAELHAGAGDWTVRQLEFRAPGHDEGVDDRRAAGKTLRLTISRPRSASTPPDPDALMSWLQGRSDLTYRSQKPLRLRGDVSVAPNSFAIDGMKAELDGGAVEGRVAVSHPQPSGGARVEADLKAERLDLDAASGFRALAGGPAGRMAGGGATLAQRRPRDLVGAGVAAAGGNARLQSEDDLAGSVEDRPARRRDDGGRAAASTAPMPPASWR